MTKADPGGPAGFAPDLPAASGDPPHSRASQWRADRSENPQPALVSAVKKMLGHVIIINHRRAGDSRVSETERSQLQF